MEQSNAIEESCKLDVVRGSVRQSGRLHGWPQLRAARGKNAGEIQRHPTRDPAVARSSHGQSPARWWESFNDPMLDSLIDRAVRTNIDLRIAQSARCELRRSSRFSRPLFIRMSMLTAVTTASV